MAPLGYRPLPCADPVEAKLREHWYATRRAVAETPGPSATEAHAQADRQLSAYLWNQVEGQIAEDRRKHPKAKRNAPVPKGIEVGSGRVIG